MLLRWLSTHRSVLRARDSNIHPGYGQGGSRVLWYWCALTALDVGWFRRSATVHVTVPSLSTDLYVSSGSFCGMSASGVN